MITCSIRLMIVASSTIVVIPGPRLVIRSRLGPSTNILRSSTWLNPQSWPNPRSSLFLPSTAAFVPDDHSGLSLGLARSSTYPGLTFLSRPIVGLNPSSGSTHMLDLNHDRGPPRSSLNCLIEACSLDRHPLAVGVAQSTIVSPTMIMA